MNDELISIIVPIYNAEKYIERCIKSIIDQDYKNIEIILIDDGSKDNSNKICKKIKEYDNRIKFITNNKNSGVSNARNIGIENSNGKYIAFVDADDYIEKDIYINLYNNIKINNVDLAVCSYTNSDKKINDLNEEKIRQISKEDFFIEVLENKQIKGYVHNKLFKSEIIKEKNIRFNEKIYICEDLLFVCEYAKYCNTIIINNKKLYHYLRNESSSYNKKFDEKWKTITAAYDNLLKIYENTDSIHVLIYIYILVCSEIIYKMKKSSYFSIEYEKFIKNKMRHYLKYIILSPKIKILKKIKAILYSCFPVKIGILKSIYYNRRNV